MDNSEDKAIEAFHKLVDDLVADPNHNKRKYPPMDIAQDGNKIYAHMFYNGIDAYVRVPLHYTQLQTKEEKLAFLRNNKIVNQLLEKVGF